MIIYKTTSTTIPTTTTTTTIAIYPLSYSFAGNWFGDGYRSLVSPTFVFYPTDSNVLSARKCSIGPEIFALTCKRFIRCDLKSSSSKTTSSPSQKRSFWRHPPPEINKLKYTVTLPEIDHNLRNILTDGRTVVWLLGSLVSYSVTQSVNQSICRTSAEQTLGRAHTQPVGQTTVGVYGKNATFQSKEQWSRFEGAVAACTERSEWSHTRMVTIFRELASCLVSARFNSLIHYSVGSLILD